MDELQQPSFGTWLRIKRKSLDLTRQGLADRVGCSAALIRKLEAEERRPSAQIVERLAEIFRIPLTERPAFLRYARGDLSSIPSPAREGTPWQLEKSPPRLHLPFIPTSLIGREQDLANLQQYISNPDIRLITLVGPPGIGKTRLALEVAHQSLPNFADGVFFVALAPLNQGGQIAVASLQVLGYLQTRNQPAEDQLRSGIGDKRMLLVLDNCEHLIEGAASLVADLLSGCPQLEILVTSREALRVPGEWHYVVPPLGMPQDNRVLDLESAQAYPALTLFTERARAVRQDFSLTPENLQAVASICARLDGLPLAIELISSRIRLMSAQTLLQHLSDPFVLSTDGMRTVSARQKTLNQAIGWSYDSLPPEEQQLFAHLAVFSGGFTLLTAKAMFSDLSKGRPVLDLITSLSDKSLLQRRLDEQGETRFTILRTIQQYALDRLREINGEAATRHCHLVYFLDLAEQGSKEMRGPAQVEWGHRLEREFDNFRAALEWAVTSQETESALRLLGALGWPWEVQGHYHEARNAFDKIRCNLDVHEFPLLYTRVLNHIGRYCWTQENICDTQGLLEESRDIALQSGHAGELSLAETLNWLGLVMHYNNHDPLEAKSMFEQSLNLCQKWEDPQGVALSTFHLGLLENDLHHDEKALSLLEKALSSFQESGDLFFIARTSIFLGYLYLKGENYLKAQQFFEQQLVIDTALHFWDGIAEGWNNLGNLYRRQYRYIEASRCFEESVKVCHEHGLVKFSPYYLSGLMALHQDNYALAFQRFYFLLEFVQKNDREENIGVLLTGFAAVAAGNAQPERSARLYGAGQARIHATNEHYPLSEREAFERHILQVRDQLGTDVFESHQAEGSLMTLKEGITYALQDE